MDSAQFLGVGWRVMHRHGEEWIQMERRRAHDPAETDPERLWGEGTIYACPQCDDQIRVAQEGEPR